MDLINKFMNIVAPLITIITILLLLPPYLVLKFSLWILRFIFSENVDGKVVLITGASSGIGEQLAYQYAKRRARLVLIARRENHLKEVAERARRLGSPDVLVVPADISKIDECRRFVDEAINHFGRLDHLVSNAGVASLCMFEDCTDIKNSSPMMDINFWGSIYTTHFAIPHLRKNKGKIIVNGSTAGLLPVPGMIFYSASKAALIKFYETLRVELGGDVGITIVTPGLIESEISLGKHLSKEGVMEVDQEKIDVQVGAFPVGNGEGCAKAIVNSACRGERYLTEPSWCKVFFLWKMFCPEVLEWCLRLMWVTKPGTSQKEITVKNILDVAGTKSFIYTNSVQSPELKSDGLTDRPTQGVSQLRL